VFKGAAELCDWEFVSEVLMGKGVREVATVWVVLLLMCYRRIGGCWSERKDWSGVVGLDCHLFRDFGYVI
jgi:hypothetical protein